MKTLISKKLLFSCFFIFLSAISLGQELQITKFVPVNNEGQGSRYIIPGRSYYLEWNKKGSGDDYYNFYFCADASGDINDYTLIQGRLPRKGGKYENVKQSATIFIPCSVVSSAIDAADKVSVKSIYGYFRMRRIVEGTPVRNAHGNAYTKVIVGGPRPLLPQVELACQNGENNEPPEICFPTTRWYAPVVRDTGDDPNDLDGTVDLGFPEKRIFYWYDNLSYAIEMREYLLGIEGQPNNEYIKKGTPGDVCFDPPPSDDLSEPQIFYVVIYDNTCSYNSQYLVDFATFVLIPNVEIKNQFPTDVYLYNDKDLPPEQQCKLVHAQYFPLTDVESEIIDVTDISLNKGTIESSTTIEWFHYLPDSDIYEDVGSFSSINDRGNVEFADRKVCVSDIKKFNNPNNYRDYVLRVSQTVTVSLVVGENIENEEDVECIREFRVRVHYIDEFNLPTICESRTFRSNGPLNPLDFDVAEDYKWTPEIYLSDPTVLNPTFDHDAAQLDRVREINYILEKRLVISAPDIASAEFVLYDYKCVDAKVLALIETPTPDLPSPTPPKPDPEKPVPDFPDGIDRDGLNIILFENPLTQNSNLSIKIESTDETIEGNIIDFHIIKFDKVVYKGVAEIGQTKVLDGLNLDKGVYFVQFFHSNKLIDIQSLIVN